MYYISEKLFSRSFCALPADLSYMASFNRRVQFEIYDKYKAVESYNYRDGYQSTVCLETSLGNIQELKFDNVLRQSTKRTRGYTERSSSVRNGLVNFEQTGCSKQYVNEKYLTKSTATYRGDEETRKEKCSHSMNNVSSRERREIFRRCNSRPDDMGGKLKHIKHEAAGTHNITESSFESNILNNENPNSSFIPKFPRLNSQRNILNLVSGKSSNDIPNLQTGFLKKTFSKKKLLTVDKLSNIMKFYTPTQKVCYIIRRLSITYLIN